MCQVISADVIYKKAVVKVADLDKIYIITELQNTPHACNTDHRSKKLKVRTEKHEQFSTIIGFYPIGDNGGFQS